MSFPRPNGNVRSDTNARPPEGDSPKKPLRSALYLGLIVFLSLLALLIFLLVKSGLIFAPKEGQADDVFYRQLREYDAALTGALPAGPAAELNARLDRLEKSALSVESRLSVLKRRRNLALMNDTAANRAAYRTAAEGAAAAYPFAESLAAVAVEALTLEARTAADSSPELFEKARAYADQLSADSFLPLALSVYVLAGDLADPDRAAAVPHHERLLLSMNGVEQEGWIRNAALLRLLAQDITGTRVLLQSLLTSYQASERGMGTAFRFGAEYFYDFGDPLRAAELFSRFPGPVNIARQADALWLADRREAAAALRTLLVSPDEAGDPPPHDTRLRSLYNLAAGAPAKEAEQRWLERLLAEDPNHSYGIIRYTRLVDAPRAIAILEGTNREALLDLELLKRKMETWPPDRLIPETWMLLGRHSEDAPVYQWGAWYFDWQKRYEETALLLRTAGYHHIDGPWMALHESLTLIREGQLKQAQELLEACLSPSGQVWQIHANLGRIFEAERSTAKALEHYEAAAALVTGNADIARVQLRLARVLRSLGRDRESRQALEYGREKDPDNIHIRLELGRLD